MCPKTSDRLALCMINYNGELYLEESLASVFVQKEKFEEILHVVRRGGLVYRSEVDARRHDE